MPPMPHFIFALILALAAAPAQAWNAAGHRLVAVIAWQQLDDRQQQLAAQLLAAHPDHPRWQQRAKSAAARTLFAEAATWPDDIRADPRFHDDDAPPTPAIAGLPDTARHRHWHYVDLDETGQVRDGELDRQLERLSQLLRSTAKNDEIAWALPWLLHLVADVHQPLHVGRHGDAGGNQVEIENPFNRRLPFTSLHAYWDDLPGPPWLRGRRLDENATRLTELHPQPVQGTPATWLAESHRLLAGAYPETAGSLLPIVSEEFQQKAQQTAERRLVDAGYRLGRLLNDLLALRVSRETP